MDGVIDSNLYVFYLSSNLIKTYLLLGKNCEVEQLKLIFSIIYNFLRLYRSSRRRWGEGGWLKKSEI